MSAGEPLRVGVLASGAGTNLQALLDTVHGHEAQVVGVAGDKPQAPAFERARERGIEVAAFERSGYADRESRDEAMAAWLAERGVRLVVTAGYLQLLTGSFLRRFPDAVINVHPSLLPAFPGLRVIAQAVDYGVKVFGVTVHYLDDGIDTGPIILQAALEIPDARDPDAVHDALRPLEHRLLPEAVRLFARGALRRDPANPRRVLIG